MLLANYFVAEELIKKVGKAAFLRSHPTPDLEQLNELKKVSSVLGLPLDTSSASTLSMSLSEIISRSDATTNQTITQLLMHPMKQAQYMVVDKKRPLAWRHYALSIPYYTHFTSPIRRYADVMVHRLLDLGLRDPEAARALAQTPGTIEAMQGTACHNNEMKKLSKTAQERSDRVFLSVYLRDRPRDYTGIVIGLGSKSFSILVLEFGFEERIMVDEMVGVTSVFDEAAGRLSLTRRASAPVLVTVPGAAAAAAGGVAVELAVNTTRGLPDKLAFESTIELSIMTPVVVHLSAKTLPPPIDLFVSFVRLATAEDAMTLAPEEIMGSLSGVERHGSN